VRKKVNLKVRQPLQRILIPSVDEHTKHQISLIEELIKTEVNIKSVEYLSDSEGFIKKKVKPNFKTLGARMGQRMKSAAAAILLMSQADINQLELTKSFDLQVNNEMVTIGVEDVDIIAEDIPGWSVANKGNLTVALDITVTDELQEEGNARELVNRIQKIRKDSGLDLTDRIIVTIEERATLLNSINNYREYICNEILANELIISENVNGGTEIDVNDVKLNIHISKIV
jgi:isoleucyl-tRNA synthetase